MYIRIRKDILVVVGLLLFQLKVIAQKAYYTDIAKYEKAYEYIINDSINQNKKITVSDTIVNLDFIIFWNELKNNEDSSSVTTRLYSLPVYEPFYYGELSCLRSEKNSKTILSFQRLNQMIILCVRKCLMIEENIKGIMI